MSALVGAGRLDEACEVLDWMADSGVAGNAVVYQTLINAFLEGEQQDKVGGAGCRACMGLDGWVGRAGLAGRLGWLGASVPQSSVVGGQGMEDPKILWHSTPLCALPPLQVDWLLERMRRDGVQFSHLAVGRLTGFCLSRGQPHVAFQLFKARGKAGWLPAPGVCAAFCLSGCRSWIVQPTHRPDNGWVRKA